jgi:hypothetical protein
MLMNHSAAQQPSSILMKKMSTFCAKIHAINHLRLFLCSYQVRRFRGGRVRHASRRVLQGWARSSGQGYLGRHSGGVKMGEICKAPDGFSYEDVDASVATEMRERADRIRKSVFNSGIEAGCHLRWVKQRLPHGQFGAWLRAELGMSERTAQNWMRVATTFEGKYETVSDLPQATVYRLAAKSTPDAVREEVVRLSEQGLRPDASAIEAMVRDAASQRRASASAKSMARQQEDAVSDYDQQPLATDIRDPFDEDEKIAAMQAAELIAERFGEDFPELLAIIQRSGLELPAALREIGSKW